MTEHKYSSVTGKDTIYVDIDDEITTIIDKLRGSPQKIVALVLPKRATVLQSVVNMKLLKRTADDANKQLVLITSEASLLPLAGSVGLYVAKSLQSKPEVPLVPKAGDLDVSEDEPLLMDDEASTEEPVDSSKPVGELAGKKRSPTAVDETIDLDDAAPAAASKGKNAGKGKLKVPNFDRFRLLLILGVGGIILLVVGWILCFTVLPKATLTISTNASQVDSNITATLSTATPTLDEKGNVVPAQVQQTQKQYSQQTPATGQKDEGTKASGTITFTNCSLEDLIAGTDRTIPAGTGVSANGLTFITQQSVTVSPSNFTAPAAGTCKNNKQSSAVPMIAQSAGEKYNISATSYTVANSSTITGKGSNTSGGTSNIVKIISQADIDAAKQKITTQDTGAIKLDLQAALQRLGLLPLPDTFKASDPAFTTTANAGDQGENVGVNAAVTYTMFGAKQEDLQKLVANDVKKHIDTDKQVILENDITKASFAVQSQDGSKVVMAIHATSIAGPDLKVEDLKKQVAGKKSKTAADLIKANPGVTDVKVDFSPFWVSSIPGSTGKITIIIEKPTRNGSANQ